jgi:hypothetical protein
MGRNGRREICTLVAFRDSDSGFDFDLAVLRPLNPPRRVLNNVQFYSIFVPA